MKAKNINAKPIYSTFFAVAVTCLFCQTAKADLILAFSIDNGASFSNSFEVLTGESLTIGIYAQQNGMSDELTDPAKGLASFGFDLTSNLTGLGNISLLAQNPFYDLENHNVTTSTGFEWEYFRADTTSLNAESIFLGEFQYNTISDGTTLFAIEDRTPGSGLGNASWLTPGLEILDEEFFGVGATNTYQFTVSTSAVPEPGPFVLLSLSGIVISMRRRRA